MHDGQRHPVHEGDHRREEPGVPCRHRTVVRNGRSQRLDRGDVGWPCRPCGINWHTHDPGVVLTHLAVAIADGADCLADMASLREQSELFGPVASIATAWRAVGATTAFELRAIPEAIAAARAKVWAAAPPGDSLVFDFDATLVNSYSEKEDAAPTYKKGFGFFPLGVWCDTTNEPLAAMLRSGNSGANDADDHITLLHQTALSGLPEEYEGRALLRRPPGPGSPPDPGAGRRRRGHSPLRGGHRRGQLRLLHRIPHRPGSS